MIFESIYYSYIENSSDISSSNINNMENSSNTDKIENSSNTDKIENSSNNKIKNSIDVDNIENSIDVDNIENSIDVDNIEKLIDNIKNSIDNIENFDEEYNSDEEYYEYDSNGELIIYAQECNLDNIEIDDIDIDKPNRICIKGDCPNIASFGENTKPEYCSIHKPKNAIDLIHKKCEDIDCNKQASCGIEGTRHVQFCGEHCPPNMINLTSNRCIFVDEDTEEKCTTMASCNYLGETIRLYCSRHKITGMIDIVNINNLCKTDKEVCPKRANFNTKGEKIALYCQTHAIKGMVNVLDKRKCETCNDKRPMYNFSGMVKGRFCLKDKEEGMINIFAKKCKECNKNPIFNKPEFKNGLMCIDHKDGDMIDIRHKRCKTPLCLTRANKKFDMHCFYCFVNLFPDDKRVRNYKTKEKTVAEFIKRTYPHLNWIEDKIIKYGCSRRRPDLLLDIEYDTMAANIEYDTMAANIEYDTMAANIENDTMVANIENDTMVANIENKMEETNPIIIIEIDENEHAHYESICENRRLMELSKDLNHRSLVIIKFNPDKYKKNGKNIQSCWEVDKTTGLSVIRKSKKTEWEFRLNILKKEVDKWIITKTDKMVEIIRLFYTEE